MPVESNIELGSGHLYFNGADEPAEIRDAKIISDEEIADDGKHINLSTEPIEFECTAEFNRNWTLVKCCRCGSNMPVTEFWALLYGRNDWICPMCKYKEAVIEALRRSK